MGRGIKAETKIKTAPEGPAIVATGKRSEPVENKHNRPALRGAEETFRRPAGAGDRTAA